MNADERPSSQQDRSQRPNGRWRRLLRKALVTMAVICVIGGFSLWVLTRSWFIIWRATPELERRLGGEVEVGGALYAGNGRFEFTDVRVLSREHHGAAALILSVGAAAVTVEQGSLYTGRLRIRELEVDEVVLRMSEDAHRLGEFSFMALDPDWSDLTAADLQRLPPRVLIAGATLEVGTHDRAQYTAHSRRRVAGWMVPSDADRTVYEFQLRELRTVSGGDEGGGILVGGQWNVLTNEYAMSADALELDRRTYEMCPRIAQVWWDEMALEGRLDRARVSWKVGSPPSVRFDVENVRLTIPFDARDVWARLRGGQIEPESSRPRMHVRSGTIRLERDQLMLDRLVGEFGGSDDNGDLVSVPYNVTVNVPTRPVMDVMDEQDWMEEVIATAPFEMSFQVQDFKLASTSLDEAPAVELPRVVAEVLAKFEMTGWELSTTIAISRAPPTVGAGGELIAGPIVTKGRARINEASGQFHRFRYPLTDVEAMLDFDNERVVLHYLTGKGSGGVDLRMSGEISPPGKDAQVELRLVSEGIAVDDRLREALKPATRRVYDALLHQESYDRLSDAGILADEARIEAWEQELEGVTDELVRLRRDAATSREDADALNRLEKRGARLQRRVNAGPFIFGGTVDLDLRIQRARGPDQPTDVTGTVAARSPVGLVFKSFPYPMTIMSGRLEWGRDRILIPSDGTQGGLEVVMPGGGYGLMTGKIDFPRVDGGRRLVPDLTIGIRNDEINEALLSAIPLSSLERKDAFATAIWPGNKLSHAANLLRGAGVTGSMTYAGTLAADETGRITYDFVGGIEDGSARPDAHLAGALGAAGLLWPGDFIVEDIQCLLQISNDSIRLAELNGRHAGGAVSAAGEIGFTPGRVETHLSLDLENLVLGPFLLNLMDDDRADRAHAWWEKYNPQGTFDAHFDYSEKGTTREHHVRVMPGDVSVTLGETAVGLTRVDGQFEVDADVISFDQLTFDLATGTRSDGRLALNGKWYVGTDAPDPSRPRLDVHGTWHGGQLASPIITEVLDMTGDGARTDHYLGLAPDGLFNAEFRFARFDGAPADYRVTVRPTTVSLTVDDTPVSLDLEPGSIVEFSPQTITLAGVSARHAGGRCDVDGTIDTSDGIRADLRLDYEGALLSRQMHAFLPSAIEDALSAIQFHDGGPSRISNAQLRMHRAVQASEQGRWTVDFTGELKTNAASLTAGLEFEEVNGIVDMDIHTAPGRTPIVDLTVRASQMRAYGFSLTDVAADMALAEDGTSFRVTDFRAESHGGVITAEAWAGIADLKDFEVRLDLVGVSIDAFFHGPLPEPGQEAPDPESMDHSSHPNGKVYANVTLSGRRDDRTSRRGRGVVRIIGGRLGDVPLVLQIMQLPQLTAPAMGSLKFADVNFYVHGDRIVFEDILFESSFGNNALFQLLGEGEMDFQTLELDTTFKSRGGVLLIRDVVGGIQDQIYLIHVTGPLRDPVAKLVTLPALTGHNKNHGVN